MKKVIIGPGGVKKNKGRGVLSPKGVKHGIIQ